MPVRPFEWHGVSAAVPSCRWRGYPIGRILAFRSGLLEPEKNSNQVRTPDKLFVEMFPVEPNFVRRCSHVCLRIQLVSQYGPGRGVLRRIRPVLIAGANREETF